MHETVLIRITSYILWMKQAKRLVVAKGDLHTTDMFSSRLYHFEKPVPVCDADGYPFIANHNYPSFDGYLIDL